MDNTHICDEFSLVGNFGSETALALLQMVSTEPAFELLFVGGTNFPALANAAHNAKGVCLSLYLPALSQTLRKLESAYRGLCLRSGVPPDLTQLLTDWNNFQNYVKALGDNHLTTISEN